MYFDHTHHLSARGSITVISGAACLGTAQTVELDIAQDFGVWSTFCIEMLLYLGQYLEYVFLCPWPRAVA